MHRAECIKLRRCVGRVEPWRLLFGMTKFFGCVRSGQGDFAQWIERFRDVYFDATGVHLYPGTLNVALDVEYLVPPSARRLESERIGGRVGVWIAPCTINTVPAFVLRTDANENDVGDHGRNIVEIASEFRLRDMFDLQDGDRVVLELP